MYCSLSRETNVGSFPLLSLFFVKVEKMFWKGLMDLKVMGKRLWGKNGTERLRHRFFPPGSQAELSYALLSRQKCSLDLLSRGIWILGCIATVTLKQVRNPTKSDLKNITFILHGWRWLLKMQVTGNCAPSFAYAQMCVTNLLINWIYLQLT